MEQEFVIGNQSKLSVAIALEWGNASEMMDEDSFRFANSLLKPIASAKHLYHLPLEFLIVYDPEEIEHSKVSSHLAPLWQDHIEWLKVTYLRAPKAAYFEKKSLAAFMTQADIVVYADSDCEYAPNWFSEIILPFHDKETMMSCGRTYAMPGAFLEQVSSLCWFFPINNKRDPQNSPKRFWGNNFAIRSEVMRQYPFVRQSDVRIWGGELVKTLISNKLAIVYSPAEACHKQLFNLSYMFRRSITLGHHNDAWVALCKRPNRMYRMRRGIMNLFKTQNKFAKRYLQLWKDVGIHPGLAIPGYIVGAIFSAVSSFSQIVSAVVVNHPAPVRDYQPLVEATETIPAY